MFLDVLGVYWPYRIRLRRPSSQETNCQFDQLWLWQGLHRFRWKHERSRSKKWKARGSKRKKRKKWKDTGRSETKVWNETKQIILLYCKSIRSLWRNPWWSMFRPGFPRFYPDRLHGSAPEMPGMRNGWAAAALAAVVWASKALRRAWHLEVRVHRMPEERMVEMGQPWLWGFHHRSHYFDKKLSFLQLCITLNTRSQ